MYHFIFLAAFSSVVAVITATLIYAVTRTRRHAGRVEEIRWRTNFESLPSRDRQCRHVFTDEFRFRECPHAFDCRLCETHAKLLARHPLTGTVEEDVFGMSFPSDRLYHRGHMWARPEVDGTMTIGLDDFGRRILGAPDVTELPAPGTRLYASGAACRMRKREAEISLLSPVDGEVIEIAGPDQDWLLRVKPRPEGFDLRHLLTPCEVRNWIGKELERLQLTLSTDGVPTLADGGVPVEADWDAVCGVIFLQG